MNWNDSNVLVTGAGRGLGRALAHELAARGARLVLVARDGAALEQVAEEIRARGGTAHVLAADVGDKDAIHPLAGAAAALVGPIDVLVHNASALGPTPLRPLLDSDCEDFERVLDVNLLGPFRLTKALAGAMALRRRGVVVHVSSDASVQAYPNWGLYSVSKAGLDHLARLFAVELAEFGVRVFSVDPGEMNTLMHAAALPEADPSTLADPAIVAGTIRSMIESSARIAPGARLEVSSWPA
jgi:NAD(P)-dependent dehydrogenase (short-subunit alcohol dehydrogenase family)